MFSNFNIGTVIDSIVENKLENVKNIYSIVL